MRSHTLLIVAALSAGALSSAHAQRADTIVKNVAAPVHPGIATLHDDLIIGQPAGAAEYHLQGITEIAPARDGSVYIAQQGAGEISARAVASVSVRQYDAAGKYLRTLGKPGQYHRIGGVTVLSDGRVAVLDNEVSRLDIYAPDGKPLTSWNTKEKTQESTGGRLTADDNGMLYMRFSLGATPGHPYTLAYLRIDSKTGRIADTLRMPHAPAIPAAMLTHKTAPKGPSITGVEPLTPRFVTMLSRQGYWITGRSDRYAIDLLKPGSPVTSIRRPSATAVPFSDDERKALRTAMEREFAMTDAGWKWNGPELPKVKPYFNHFATGIDGRIWVMVYDPAKHYTADQLVEMDRDAATLWDVYEPDARYLGQVRVEHGASVISRGDEAWMIRRDAKGGEFVVRARIVWGH